MVLQVYLDPCTVNSRKVLAGLDLLGTPFELKYINYFTGEHKSPEYLEIVSSSPRLSDTSNGVHEDSANPRT